MDPFLDPVWTSPGILWGDFFVASLGSSGGMKSQPTSYSYIWFPGRVIFDLSVGNPEFFMTSKEMLWIYMMELRRCSLSFNQKKDMFCLHCLCGVEYTHNTTRYYIEDCFHSITVCQHSCSNRPVGIAQAIWPKVSVSKTSPSRGSPKPLRFLLFVFCSVRNWDSAHGCIG